jgi:glycosyltransferase involved in cell wall biosynthesis
MKLISIVTACYNEEEDVEELYSQIVQVMSEMPGRGFEHIHADSRRKWDIFKT